MVQSNDNCLYGFLHDFHESLQDFCQDYFLWKLIR